MSKVSPKNYSAEDWNHLRERFSDSLLKDAEIAVLGQNLGISWPFKGSGETPAKYIAYEFEELQSVPGLVGKSSRVKTLMNILRETLAFDDPFSEMAESVESGSAIDDTFQRILGRLGIPIDYPVEFIHFDDATMEALRDEEVATLIDVIHFGQKKATQGAGVKGLTDFLNGLAHKDEIGITRHLPYRRGTRGLHFPEAVGLVAEDLTPEAQLHLRARLEGALTEEEEARFKELTGEDDTPTAETQAEIEAAVAKISKLSGWFDWESAELEVILKSEESGERYFLMIDDPKKEQIALQLAKLCFGVEVIKKSGFFGKLFGRD